MSEIKTCLMCGMILTEENGTPGHYCSNNPPVSAPDVTQLLTDEEISLIMIPINEPCVEIAYAKKVAQAQSALTLWLVKEVVIKVIIDSPVLYPRSESTGSNFTEAGVKQDMIRIISEALNE